MLDIGATSTIEPYQETTKPEVVKEDLSEIEVVTVDVTTLSTQTVVESKTKWVLCICVTCSGW